MSGWPRRLRDGLGATGAMLLVVLVVAPLRSMLFLDETEPFRRRRR